MARTILVDLVELGVKLVQQALVDLLHRFEHEFDELQTVDAFPPVLVDLVKVLHGELP